MNICGIICEFNPFHNGHEYLLKRARELSRCDFLVCVMSGDFTQRGEAAIMDKFTRAKHAVLAGADLVLELPAAFAVSPAEIFATGAVKILSSLPQFNTLAFGCESANYTELVRAAEILNDENGEFKSVLATELDSGKSFVKSYLSAFESVGGNGELLKKPNNILAVEYAKAILRGKREIRLLPIERIGAEYGDSELKTAYSSASAIRQNALSPLVKNNVPPYVLKDFKGFFEENKRYYEFLQLVLSRTPAENLKKIYGCGEGLENALKKRQNEPSNKLISSVTSKRYSSARIRRILSANFLGVYAADCNEFLRSPLYLTPLAVKKRVQNKIFSALANAEFPVITGGSDLIKLPEVAKKCKDLDDFAHAQWKVIAQKSTENTFISV